MHATLTAPNMQHISTTGKQNACAHKPISVLSSASLRAFACVSSVHLFCVCVLHFRVYQECSCNQYQVYYACQQRQTYLSLLPLEYISNAAMYSALAELAVTTIATAASATVLACHFQAYRLVKCLQLALFVATTASATTITGATTTTAVSAVVVLLLVACVVCYYDACGNSCCRIKVSISLRPALA
jgi:hypothetical protein